MVTYKNKILSEEIKKLPDNDTSILKAWYTTAKKMIETNCSKQEAQSFMKAFKSIWGEYKAVDLRGDFIDANILTK